MYVCMYVCMYVYIYIYIYIYTCTYINALARSAVPCAEHEPAQEHAQRAEEQLALLAAHLRLAAHLSSIHKQIN